MCLMMSARTVLTSRFLAEEKPQSVRRSWMTALMCSDCRYSLWSVGRWTPPRSQHSSRNPKKQSNSDQQSGTIWPNRRSRWMGLRVPGGCGLWWWLSRLHSGSWASQILEGRHRPDCDPESQTTDAEEEKTNLPSYFKNNQTVKH